MKCLLCEDSSWVCENHSNRPWQGEHACQCGGAGMPCPSCNVPDDGEAPRMPEGFKTRWTKTAGGIDGMAAPFGDPIPFLCYQFEHCFPLSFATDASIEI